jgi:hypothetical protein
MKIQYCSPENPNWTDWIAFCPKRGYWSPNFESRERLIAEIEYAGFYTFVYRIVSFQKSSEIRKEVIVINSYWEFGPNLLLQLRSRDEAFVRISSWKNK